ncbi:hypothetical protein D4Q85_00080 [bacterium]|nr:MAG: hypothetical protein D4Q85_00080 [bacterium]
MTIEQLKTLFSGTVTADESETAVAVYRSQHAAILVNVTAKSGTTPTLVPTIEISDDFVIFYHRGTVVDHETQGVLTRTTAPTVEGKIQTTGQYELMLDGNIGKFMRVSFVLSGTDPSFTLTVKAILT